MRSLFLTLVLALAPLIRAQENVATVVVYVTADPTPAAAPTVLQQIATSTTPADLPSSTFATQTSSVDSISSAASSTPSASSAAGGTEYNAPGSAGSASSGSDLGASGSDGGNSFSLSKGAIAGIIVVVVLVALFGIASTILFVIAKRRSWTIRETLRRGSRRLTGRGPTAPPSSSRKGGVMIADRGSRKAIRIDSPQRQPHRGGLEGKGWGHKRGLLDSRDRGGDLEKGKMPGVGNREVRALDGRGAGARKETGWVGKMWGGGWK
ncbi:hypothetical protein B0A48_10645 [Cryoendolithus antarcticus]|uniref:Mid2 domain-containing protein n=1 Tax=Cryoendolithus antarcticus TaxID=1507870 RepID=A0A1V8SYL5_9PEZI|nr:hypothetical protein B0A48_10645 [Cryoendolithus antarcticus]